MMGLPVSGAVLASRSPATPHTSILTLSLLIQEGEEPEFMSSPIQSPIFFQQPLNWLQRTEIQASKHWRAMSPGALAGTVWAWGRLNYTPSRGDSPLHAYLDYSNKAECRQCKTGLACGRSCKATDRAEDSMCCRKTKAHVVHQSWQAEKKRRTKLAEETHPISIKEKETQWLKSFDRQQRNPCRAFTESFSGTAF
eukprot:scaffold71050_cov22-Tisochrysis_lutea.AAC.3